jgi:hypothetical protein
MALYLEPHTPEWFIALDTFDLLKAAVTRQILKSAGRNDVCGICGGDPAADFRILGKSQSASTVATIRLCQDCRVMRGMNGDVYEPF